MTASRNNSTLTTGSDCAAGNPVPPREDPMAWVMPGDWSSARLRASGDGAAGQAGTVADPGWLAACRQYLSRMLAGGQGSSAGTELVS